MTLLYKLPFIVAIPVLSMAMIACQSNPPTNATVPSTDSAKPNKTTAVSLNGDKGIPDSTTINDTTAENATTENTDEAFSSSADPKAPWSNPAIAISATDAIYYQEWLKSENKSVCPILALPKQADAHLARHSVRRARFSGGWGVAYDLPNTRSMYGVANTGIINPSEAAYDWPYNIYYTDGSKVGYGHEGGDPTASWLAYVVTPNNCMYNVWSAQDKAHLEQMIADLRMVNPIQ